MMNMLNRSQCRVGDAAPAVSNRYEGPCLASSGHVAIGQPTYFFLLVPYTNVMTIGLNPNLRKLPGPSTVVTGKPLFDVQEIRLPTIEEIMPEWREEDNVADGPTQEERARRHVPTFLNEIYSLSQRGDTDTAGFKIYDYLDRLLIDGFFAVCDNILSRVDIEKLDTKLMRSFLSITIPAKQKLPSRKVLYEKIEAKLLMLRGEVKTRRILANLA